MTRPWIRLVAWLAITTGGIAPAAAEPTLGLEDALSRALTHSPRVAQAQLRVAQARTDAEAQRWWWARAVRTNLNLGLPGAGATAITPDGTLLPTAALGVALNLGEVLTAPLTSTRADQAVAIAEAEARAATLELANQIVQAHAEHAAARAQAGLATLAVEAAEAEWRTTERRFSQGLVDAGMLARARLARAAARAEAVRTASLQARAWAQLTTLVGDPALALVPSLALDGR